MANPTTNYSFAMPTNTDLVKDLPADFEIFGQAVDTQMKTNADAAIAKSIVDAKGDLIAATGADAVTRVAVGTNGQYLKADSTASGGISWDTLPASGGMTLLQSLSLSGSSVTSSTLSSAYKQFLIYIKGASSNSGNNYCSLRLNGDTGSNYSWNHNIIGTSINYTNGYSDTMFRWGTIDSIGTDLGVTKGIITIMRPSDTDFVFIQSNIMSRDSSGSANQKCISFGAYDSSAAITSITIFPELQNFDAGTAEIYGVN